MNPLVTTPWSLRVTVAPTGNWTAQYSYGPLLHPEAPDPSDELRQSASVEYNRALPGGKLGRGNRATSVIWRRKHKQLDDTTQNSYLLESTLNFLTWNYAYTRLELVDKDELFPEAATHPAYRIGAYTFGGVRDLLHNKHWQVGVGGDVTFYSQPAVLNSMEMIRCLSVCLGECVRDGWSTCTDGWQKAGAKAE
jgi:hypothetical protein